MTLNKFCKIKILKVVFYGVHVKFEFSGISIGAKNSLLENPSLSKEHATHEISTGAYMSHNVKSEM